MVMTIQPTVSPSPSSQPVAIDRIASGGRPQARFQRGQGAQAPRFATLFPVSARVLFHPGAVLVAILVGAPVAALFSLHYAAAVILLGLIVVFVGRERRFLDVLLLTPNLLAARGVLMGGVVGCAYMGSAMADGDSWALLAVQAAMMYWIVVSGVLNGVCLSGIPGIQMPWASSRFTAECLRPLAVVGFALLLLELLRQLIGIATGSLDRGIYGDEAARQAFGIWTYFSIFPRLSSTCMFLAPVLWRVSRGPLRIVGLGMVGLLLVVGLSTGSRGLFLTPLVYLAVGIYFFLPLRRVPLEMILGISVVAFAPLVLLMASYRSSQEFRQTHGSNVTERVKGLARAATAAHDQLDEAAQSAQSRFIFGVQMLGVSDQMVYEKTPSEYPYVGLENIERIAYVWIPKFFMPDKPYLQDGNDIVVGYTGVFHKRSARTISLTGDLYRRFGVPGILIGIPLAALITALFTRWIFRVLLFRDALLGIVLLQLLLSGFNVEWWGTLLSSSFDWLYAIPKHLVLIFVLVGVARFVTGTSAKRGLLAYTEAT
jgi:hypothetical protein